MLEEKKEPIVKKVVPRKNTLSGLIETGLESIEDPIVLSIIELFDSMCLSFDEGKGEKEAFFHELFSQYGGAYEQDIGYVIPSVEETKRVVVSHMDLISLYNRGFKKGKKYKVGLNIENKEVIMGALDNTFTNAVTAKVLMTLLDQGRAKDTTFVFTEREEIDFGGMRGYLRKYGNKPFFINLDVTSDNRKFHTSIEFDEANWSICKQIFKQKEEFTSGFTTDRVDDDMDAILRAGGQGFSYCIPTWKTIHSYSNFTLIENILPYYKGLLFLVDELDLSEGIEHDIKNLSIKKAIKKNDKEKFLKAEKKAEKKRKKRYNDYEYSSHNSLSLWDWEDDDDDEDEDPGEWGESISNSGNILYDKDTAWNRYFDDSSGKVQTEDEFLDSITSSSLFDDEPSSSQIKIEKQIQEASNEMLKRGYPFLNQLRDMLKEVLFEGGFISLSRINSLVYENANSFGLSFSQNNLIAEISENIFMLLKDTLNLRIICEEEEWWGV